MFNHFEEVPCNALLHSFKEGEQVSAISWVGNAGFETWFIGFVMGNMLGAAAVYAGAFMIRFRLLGRRAKKWRLEELKRAQRRAAFLKAFFMPIEEKKL